MEPNRALIDELFWEKVCHAERMSPGERILAGPRLHDFACEIAMDRIRAQFPNAAEEEVIDILRKRLELARRLEQQR